MRVIEILASVSATASCKIPDVLPKPPTVKAYEALTEALEDGDINCVDGYLHMTAQGRARYLNHRESRRGG